MSEPNQRAKILAIDGCRKTLNQIHDMLRGEYEVLFATTAETGIEMARQHQPDAILLDIEPPDLDGIETCYRLKSLPVTESTPVMFMSAKVSDEEHDQVFQAGASDFLRKPLRKVEVQNRVYNQIRQCMNQRLIERRALYDDLTHVPGRTLTFDRLCHALAQSSRDGSKTAVLFIDLDDFKAINDSLGHEAGDRLLIQAALRFTRHVRKGDTVGRLSGDEFAIVLAGLTSTEDAKKVAEEIQRAFETPFMLGGISKHVGLSIGVAVSPDDSSEPSRLMACADTAMYQAKRQGQGQGSIKFYTSIMNQDATRRIQLERNLKTSVANDEMFVHYQPVMDLERNLVVGAEALARWNSPSLGAVAPSEFVRQAEQSGQIWSIGEFVLRRACEDFLELTNQQGEPLRLCVNVSPQQIRRGEFPELVAKILSDTGFAGERLEIEVTENLLLNRGGVVDANLQALSGMGLRLSMDDFGTGFSSLCYLSQYKFDSLKIDRMLVEGMMISEQHDALVSASIWVARAFKIDVVAEAVETASQLASLRQKQCRYAQGNYICAPMTVERLHEEWLNDVRPDRPQLQLVRSASSAGGPQA